MAFGCTHRSVTYSVITREASFCSIWEKNTENRSGYYAHRVVEWDWGRLALNGKSLSNCSPQSSGKPVDEEGERVEKSEG